MSISRRGFLAGIFAAASAPAIVKANNLMKLNSGILVPNKIITLPITDLMRLGADFDGDTLKDTKGRIIILEPVNSDKLDFPYDNDVYVHTDFIRYPVITGFKLKELIIVR